VPDLGQFVDAELPDDAADTRDPRIILLRPNRLPSRLGIVPHRAKLQYVERLAIETNPALAEEGWSLALELHGDGGDGDDRRGDDQQQQAYGEIEDSFGDGGEAPPRREAIREDQP